MNPWRNQDDQDPGGPGGPGCPGYPGILAGPILVRFGRLTIVRRSHRLVILPLL
jgi:hypothetical protein